MPFIISPDIFVSVWGEGGLAPKQEGDGRPWGCSGTVSVSDKLAYNSCPLSKEEENFPTKQNINLVSTLILF